MTKTATKNGSVPKNGKPPKAKPKQWQIAWRDLPPFTEDDLTVADATLAQTWTGAGWESLDPRGGPAQCAGLIFARLIASGMTPEAATEEVGSATVTELVAAIGKV